MEFSIESTSTLFDSSGKPYTSYSITTHYQGQRFQAQRRYREFVALHDGLRGEVSGLPHHFPVWPFHLNRLAPEVVDSRRVALCSYLSAALAALHGGVMPARLRSFLQLPQAQANRMTAPAGPSGAAALLPLEKSDTVILVAYQLPLTVSRAEGGGWEVEWDDESVLNQHALSLGCRVMWVGGVGCAVDPDEEEGLAQVLLEGYSCLPVFLPAALTDRFYHGFCRSYLRPVFHNRMRLPDSGNPFCEEDWRAYSAANRKFADTVMEVYEPGHMVWAHDYHLLLLPSFLLRRHRTAHIGLFLHSPFPASDVFRSVAVREELLRAMLHADMVGFLLFEYTRGFLTSCKLMN